MKGTVMPRLQRVLLFRKIEALFWPHHTPITNNQTGAW